VSKVGLKPLSKRPDIGNEKNLKFEKCIYFRHMEEKKTKKLLLRKIATRCIKATPLVIFLLIFEGKLVITQFCLVATPRATQPA